MVKTWMIAGHQYVTTHLDGVESSVQTMLDIQFVDGLLNWVIYMISRASQNKNNKLDLFLLINRISIMS